LRRLARLLVESTQDVNRLRKFRHIEDPELAVLVDAYFAHADTHGRHGLPITWIEPLLHAIKLVAPLTPRAFRKATDFAQTVAAPNDWLHAPRLCIKKHA